MSRAEGFTLLEVLVAMSIFLSVVVPLIPRMADAVRDYRSMDMLIASCIIEQESALVMTNPRAYPLRKKRVVKGRTWTVEARISGGPLYSCALTVFKERRKIEDIRFYRYYARDMETTP